MNHPRIKRDPKIMEGKPIIVGTGITVEHILRCLAAGESEAEIIADYPPLSLEDIREAQAYAADYLGHESMISSLQAAIAGQEVMKEFDRITQNPAVMGGKPCIRGMRVTVGMIVGQIGAGETIEALLEAYPYLEREDIMQALRYAAWRAQEREIVLADA